MDSQPTDVLSDDVFVDVESSHEVKTVWSESGIVDDGPSEPAHSNDRHVPVCVDTQYLAETVQEVVNAVPPALFAESPEITEVLADLGRRHLQLFAQLLGTNHHDTVFHQAVQDAQVLWQTAHDDFGNFRTGYFWGKRVAGHRFRHPQQRVGSAVSLKSPSLSCKSTAIQVKYSTRSKPHLCAQSVDKPEIRGYEIAHRSLQTDVPPA